MKRLPSRNKLDSMHWQDGIAILDAEANKTRDTIAHIFMHKGYLDRYDNSLRRRLKRIYAIANDYGTYVGQPDYRPQYVALNTEDRTRREMYQAMYEGDRICRALDAEKAAT